MITIHAIRFVTTSGWRGEYQDWLIDPGAIVWCDPILYMVTLIDGAQFKILGLEWPKFKQLMTEVTVPPVVMPKVTK